MHDLKLERILVATDFGEVAERALGDAGRLALAFGAEIELLHVLPSSERDAPHPEIQARLEDQALALTERGARVLRSLVTCGSAAESILHAAERSGSDLIVIGAGDHARYTATGPTAETVARFSPKPVWVSHLDASNPLSRVLCAVDSSAASDEAFRLAHSLSQRFSATLHLWHVCENSRVREAELSALRVRLGAQGAERVPLHVSDGRASDELHRAAVDLDIDLLVMGRVGGGLRRVFLGGTAERLLRRLPAALLLTGPRS